MSVVIYLNHSIVILNINNKEDQCLIEYTVEYESLKEKREIRINIIVLYQLINLYI